MEKVTGKEGKGVRGTGFEGETGSNSYSALPRSSNAELGIDAEVATGIGEAVRTPDSKGLNVGPPGTSGEDDMSNAKFGIGDDIAGGTVEARKRDDMVNPGSIKPTFGVSAKGGNPTGLNEDSYYGSGARKAGTAAAFGEPGRGGSMALAIKGLSGNTSGPAADGAKQPAAGAQKDLRKAEGGMRGSGGKE